MDDAVNGLNLEKGGCLVPVVGLHAKSLQALTPDEPKRSTCSVLIELGKGCLETPINFQYMNLAQVLISLSQLLSASFISVFPHLARRSTDINDVAGRRSKGPFSWFFW